MKKKMIHLAVVIMMFTAIACGEAGTDKTGTKETGQNQESGENKNSQQEKIETSDKTGEKEESEESAEGTDEAGDPTDQEAAPTEETEGRDITETQMQELYACIKESVRTKYLEPNGISADDFVWPRKLQGNLSDPEELAWYYFDHMYNKYYFEGTYDVSDFPSDLDLPSDQNQQLMRAVLDGIVEWHNIPKNSSVSLAKLSTRLAPISESIPANVDFSAE